MLTRSMPQLAAAAFALALAALPARADKTAISLALPVLTPTVSADPYYAPGTETEWVARAVFDTLVAPDGATGALRPGLATSWTWLGPRTLELELRRGVTFHDGSAFDADDVVYTLTFLSRFAEHRLPLPARFSWLAGAKKLGRYAVRLSLRRAYPAALQALAVNLPMLPSDYHRRLFAPEDFGRRPIGTGPYKVIDGADGRLVLARFGNHWRGAGAGSGHIGRIELFTVPDQEAQIAALHDGRADFVGGLTPRRARDAADGADLAATTGESLAMAYLMLNANDDDGRATARRDVRRAIAHAIDREALARRFGMAAVPGGRSAFCHPAQFGCPADAPAPAYDQDRARALLRAMRLTDDLYLDIDTYGPYRLLARAVADDLFEVTINARAEHLPLAAFDEKRAAGKLEAVVAAWGGGGMFDVSGTAAVFFEGIGNDMTGDAGLAALMRSAERAADPERRRALYEEGFRIVAAEAYVIPLFRMVPAYAHRRGLTFARDYLLGLPPLQSFAWR